MMSSYWRYCADGGVKLASRSEAKTRMVTRHVSISMVATGDVRTTNGSEQLEQTIWTYTNNGCQNLFMRVRNRITTGKGRATIS